MNEWGWTNIHIEPKETSDYEMRDREGLHKNVIFYLTKTHRQLRGTPLRTFVAAQPESMGQMLLKCHLIPPKNR